MWNMMQNSILLQKYTNITERNKNWSSNIRCGRTNKQNFGGHDT